MSDNRMIYNIICSDNHLAHYGIKGMRWGVRRYQKKDGTLTRAGKRREQKRLYSTIDPELAKNKQTRRVAYDYHNMSKAAFSAKYKTTKKRFAKRYVKTKGDTYSLGKKKAAIALAIIATEPPRKVAGVTVTGKQAVMRSLAYDGASVIIGTNLGYDNAEKKYYDKK